MRLFLALLILAEQILLLLAAFSESDICYLCDMETFFVLSMLNVVLLYSLTLKNIFMPVIVVTIFGFYSSRVLTIQWYPENYTYWDIPLTTVDMRSSVSVLFLTMCALLVGSIMGRELAGPSNYNKAVLAIFPFEKKITDVDYFYVLLIRVVVFFGLAKLILVFNTGVGLQVGNNNFEAWLKQLNKFLHTVDFLSVVPVIWLVLKKPVGSQRKLTIVGILVSIVTTLISLSKTGLLYSIIPFFLVFYVSDREFSFKLVFVGGLVLFSVVIFFNEFMTAIRRYVFSVFNDGDDVSAFASIFSVDFESSFQGFLSRLGSSFDVLSALIKNKEMFEPYLNFSDELLNVVNGFVPGELVATNAPQFSQLMPHLLNGTNLEYLMSSGFGQNIGLPGYLYLYTGTFGVVLVSILISLFYSYAFYKSDSIFVRIILLQFFVFEISNGAGIINMLLGPAEQSIWFYIAVMGYGFIQRRGFARLKTTFYVKGGFEVLS